MTTHAAFATARRFRSRPSSPPDPPPEVVLVSRYRLDSGSAADDVGAVHGTITGSWTSTSAASLVQGEAGQSFYKAGGSARVTLPAGQLAHQLGALSLGIYYQPTADDEKHVLLACGDGSQEGDFSLERLTNGRLRGWHVGQDSGLRFFNAPGQTDGTSGINTTNLVAGTAVRIILTLGPGGARIYLGNTQVSAIEQNVNGWNNARVKFIGVWVDGAASPAQGVFDHIRIWRGELLAGGIAQLEPAQSITIPPIVGGPTNELRTWFSGEQRTWFNGEDRTWF